MNRIQRALRASVVLLAAAAAAGCPDDIPEPCRGTCETCCQQDEDCTGRDYDECFSSCFDGCQRSYAVYRHTPCWDARLATKECVCALSCSALAELEEGTVDHCSTEVEQEENDCDWF